jgi:hypothetical protein
MRFSRETLIRGAELQVKSDGMAKAISKSRRVGD